MKKESSESRITKLIESDVFKSEDGEGIDADKLILFAFLNSPADLRYKSQVLYSVLQKGGHTSHEYLSHQDKDILPTIRKLMHLCTVDLVKLMVEVDLVTSPIDLEGK